jgi:hypothetical protein
MLGEGDQKFVVGTGPVMTGALGYRTPLNDSVLFSAWGRNCHSNLLL